MAKGRGRKKWRKRLQRANSPAKYHRGARKGIWDIPKCSVKACGLKAVFLIRARNSTAHKGTFWATCADCVQPVAKGVQMAGIDADVVSFEALDHITK